MDLSTVPIKSLRFRWQQDINGVILFDTKEYRSFRLNETSYLAWKMCDGNNSVRQIIEHVASNFRDVEEERIHHDIITILCDMHDKKMIFIEEATNDSA